MLNRGVVGDAHVHAGVEVLELGERGLGARDLADVLGAAVEVAAEVLDGDGAGIVDGDLFGAGEDQILGDLDSQLKIVRRVRPKFRARTRAGT